MGEPSVVGRKGMVMSVPTYRCYWPILLALVILVVMMVISRLTFGSIPVALRYLRGERLILEPARLHAEGLTESKPVFVATEIHNYTALPIRLLGSAANCSCVGVKSLPELIPAGKTAKLAFEVHTLPGKREVDQHIIVFTDNPGRPQLGVRITGQARD